MIKANFSAYSTYVTDSLHQWDINQVLTVTGLNLTSAPEVHFSNANTDRAIVRQSTMANHVVSVAIPNSLLQDPLRIKAHIGIYEGSTFKVVELVEIPVEPRKRPMDYQIEDTDEELYSFKRLENLLANAATNARVDNIIAHNNDTDGNSELVDIRTDHNGQVWASAGAAIRGTTQRLANGTWMNDGAIKRKHLDAGFASKGSVNSPSGTLADYLDAGSYMFSYGHNLPDSPFGVNPAFVLNNVWGTENYIIQTVSNLSAPQTVYTRIYRNGEVTEWRLLTPNDAGTPVVVNFGDSIFGQYQDSKSVSAKLAAILGGTVVNGGFGGTTLEPWPDGLSKNFSMVAVADAVASGNWTALANAAPTSGVDYFPNTVATLSAVDFSKVTHITLNHGTNDWARSAVIEGESTDSYKGALRYVINKLQQAYPNAKVSVISVLNRFDSGDGRTMENGNGDTLEDFANAAAEVCSDMYVNFINVFDTLGFNTNTQDYYFGESTVHPNENGNKVIADHIAKHI